MIKRKKKNPKSFNSAILEKTDQFLKEYKAELKQESWTDYNQAAIEILIIMKKYFSENDDYSNSQLISRLGWISEKLKEDVWKYTQFD